MYTYLFQSIHQLTYFTFKCSTVLLLVVSFFRYILFESILLMQLVGNSQICCIVRFLLDFLLFIVNYWYFKFMSRNFSFSFSDLFSSSCVCLRRFDDEPLFAQFSLQRPLSNAASLSKFILCAVR